MFYAQNNQANHGLTTIQNSFVGLSNHTHAPVMPGIGSSSTLTQDTMIQAPTTQWGGANIDMSPLNPVWNPSIVY